MMVLITKNRKKGKDKEKITDHMCIKVKVLALFIRCSYRKDSIEREPGAQGCGKSRGWPQ